MLLDGELVLGQNLGLTEFGRFGKTSIQSPNLELRTCVVLEFDHRGVEASYFRKYIFVIHFCGNKTCSETWLDISQE